MPKLYTVKSLAELFDKDEETIRRWIKDGDVFPSAFQIKGGWYVKAIDVKNIMKNHGDERTTDQAPRRAGRASSGFVSGWK